MAGLMESVLVRAEQLTAQGQPRSAIAVLVPALEEHPDHSIAWCRLAAAHLEAGEPAESLEAAKRAIVLGERSWAHRLASLALVELGRHDEAVVSAREAVRRDQFDWRCHVALAEALAHDAPLDAVSVAGRAVELAPDEPRPREVLGDAAARTHDWVSAENAYREALRLDPDNEDVAVKLARLGGRRPSPRPRRPPRSLPGVEPPPSYGRAERVALLLVVRRVAVWLAAGSLVLLVTGRPWPSGMVWLGPGLVAFVGFLAWRGWSGLPPGSRVHLRALSTRDPGVTVSVAVMGLAVVAVLVWTVALALGIESVAALVVSLVGAAVAAANSWFGLWRTWAASG